MWKNQKCTHTYAYGSTTSPTVQSTVQILLPSSGYENEIFPGFSQIDLFNLKFNSTWPFLGRKAKEETSNLVKQIRLIWKSIYKLEVTSNTTEEPLPLKSWNRKDDDATLPCPLHMCHHDDCACYCRCLN